MFDNCGRDISYFKAFCHRTLHFALHVLCADEGCCPKQVELNARASGSIADACADLGITRVRLTGGEPLYDATLCKLLREFEPFQRSGNSL